MVTGCMIFARPPTHIVAERGWFAWFKGGESYICVVRACLGEYLFQLLCFIILLLHCTSAAKKNKMQKREGERDRETDRQSILYSIKNGFTKLETYWFTRFLSIIYYFYIYNSVIYFKNTSLEHISSPTGHVGLKFIFPHPDHVNTLFSWKPGNILTNEYYTRCEFPSNFKALQSFNNRLLGISLCKKSSLVFKLQTGLQLFCIRLVILHNRVFRFIST